MAVEAQSTEPEKTPKGEGVASGGGGASPASAGGTLPVAVGVPVVASSPPPPRLLGGDDDDEIDHKTKYEITGSAFRKRIERDRRKLLNELAGTDDADAVKARLKKLEELEANEETKRRETLAAEERLKEDLARANEARAKAEARALEAQTDRDVEREASRISTIAKRHIDDDYVEDIVWGPFKRFLGSKSEAELAKIKDEDIDDWFKEHARVKPKFAKEAPPAPPPPPPATRVGITNGVRVDARPTPTASGKDAEKTARPGQPNSMTKAEIREKYGNSW